MGEDGGGVGGARRAQERENLRHIIQQWNANRLDLFEISEPNEDLEFHGVMRFYFQDSGQKVATKCIRVPSTANSRHVIETLVEKFRPDMRMLSIPEYALYEIHENGDERRLAEDEKPLLVQLNWNKDDREGRFLLRRMDLYSPNLHHELYDREMPCLIPKSHDQQHTKLPDALYGPHGGAEGAGANLPTVLHHHHHPVPPGRPSNLQFDSQLYLQSHPTVHTLPPHPTTPVPSKDPQQPFQRKLSKREKKELKKQEKLRRANEANEVDSSVAEKLYTELPETSFTRSISNPEAVMRRRRAQKLEKKLQQFRSKDGGPDTGGTLKIYGESLRPDVPYKTLLLSVRDNALAVVAEMLDKYGLYKEDPNNYCLVQSVTGSGGGSGGSGGDAYVGGVMTSPHKEYILEDDECPLAILMNHPPSRGSIMFHVRRRPADHGPRKRKKKPIKGAGGGGGGGPGDPHDPHPHHHHHHHHHHPRGSHQRDPHFLPDRLPFLIELGPDGNELGGTGRQHQLHLNVTEVGTDRSSAHTGGQSLQLFGPNIQPRHCVIAHTEGIVTVTPSFRDAHTFVNGQRIYETTILQHGCIVRFGRIHNFRFIDPQQDDRIRHNSSMDTGNYERYPPGGGGVAGRDPILPAVLEFREESEDAFLHAITTDLDPTDIQFKLAPTYTLYMAARFRASTHYRPDLNPTERAHRLTEMLTKVAAMVQNVIHSRHGDPTSLAFWMANASELLHFLKQDRHVSGYSLTAQDILAEAVQVAFRSLVDCMQAELSTSLPVFLEDREDANEEEGSTAHVLSILTNTMALMRRCRVNAALTIQLFSQLFHFVNMWVFNRIVADTHPNYCTRVWGVRVKRRLARVEVWAEKQGLELASDCHLARLSQAALLLQSQKSSADDIATISSKCFKLNSLQLRAILEMYQPIPDEPPIPQDLIDNVVAVAESTSDGLSREEGREVRLEEEADLQLPFLLPEDGYSCDIVRGVPSGLAEFLGPLQLAALCSMNPQPTSSGYWTIYMQDQDTRPPPGPRSPSVMSNRSVSLPRGEPEIHVIQLHKSNSGMGLSIVATKGVNQDKLGIYIKSVVPGGAADQDGRLQAGDQLLSVDGKSLIGITQERAAEYMMETGPVVTLEVARQGAIYHGLATILSQPSPHANRGYPGGRHLSERDLPSKVVMSEDQPAPPPHHLHHQAAPQPHHPRIQASKSVPSLNSEGSVGGGKPASLEVFNPSYSRTSSNTSLSQPPANPHYPHHHQHLHQQQQPHPPHIQQQQQQQQHQPPVRSRSTQNLSEGGYPSVGGVGRHPSNPTLAVEEERYYQNVTFHPDPRNRTRPGPGHHTLPLASPTSHDSMDQPRPDTRPASAFMQREDVLPPRSDLPRPASQRDLRADAKMIEMTEEVRRREERARQNGHPMPSQNIRPVQQHPQHRAPANAFPPGNVPFSPEGFPGQPANYHPGQHHPLSPQSSHSQHPAHPQGYLGKMPPPTAPKPKPQVNQQVSEAPEKPSRQLGYEGGAVDGPPRPPLPEEGYRDSPPPPPPPTSTHPLLQGARPASSVGFASQLNTKSAFNKTSPWDREQKELHERRRREAARHWRDEQINSLENLEARTNQQDERLRTLKLEREFQRRAEETNDDDDDDEDDDDDDDREDNLREREEQRGNERDFGKHVPPNNQAPEPRMNGGGPADEERARKVDEIRRKQQELEAAKEAEERLLREAQRRQQEEQTRRLQQEQQQQQQLLLQQQQQIQQQQQQQQQQRQQSGPTHYQHQHHASQRLDSLVAAPYHHSQYSNGPVNGNRGSQTAYHDQLGSHDRPENLIAGAQHSPVPPERGSSYSVMHQTSTTTTPTPSGPNNRYKGPDVPPPTTVKRVQFSETNVETQITYDNNANQEKTPRQDPNNFINEAETLLNSSPTRTTGGSTPGVIGAQEVYRDPRMRRLQQKQAEQAAAKNPGPEKLTFKEKMKMFAMETGEAETPKDKVKISRAQRDIEH